jgi:hypothetical protein
MQVTDAELSLPSFAIHKNEPFIDATQQVNVRA